MIELPRPLPLLTCKECQGRPTPRKLGRVQGTFGFSAATITKSQSTIIVFRLHKCDVGRQTVKQLFSKSLAPLLKRASTAFAISASSFLDKRRTCNRCEIFASTLTLASFLYCQIPVILSRQSSRFSSSRELASVVLSVWRANQSQTSSPLMRCLPRFSPNNPSKGDNLAVR